MNPMSKYHCSLLSGLILTAMVGCRNSCQHEPCCATVVRQAVGNTREHESPKELPKRNDSAVLDVAEAELPSKLATPGATADARASQQKRRTGPIFKAGGLIPVNAALAGSASPGTLPPAVTGAGVKEPPLVGPTRGEPKPQ